jgi:hypothetical protein
MADFSLPDPWRPGSSISPVAKSAVKAITLSDYCTEQNIDHIDFLKIDVEGAELDVLIGAKELLNHCRIGSIMFEVSLPQVHAMNHKPEDIFDYLLGFNYHIFGVESGGKLAPWTKNESFKNYQNYIASVADLSGCT